MSDLAALEAKIDAKLGELTGALGQVAQVMAAHQAQIDELRSAPELASESQVIAETASESPADPSPLPEPVDGRWRFYSPHRNYALTLERPIDMTVKDVDGRPGGGRFYQHAKVAPWENHVYDARERETAEALVAHEEHGRAFWLDQSASPVHSWVQVTEGPRSTPPSVAPVSERRDELAARL